MGSNSGAAQGIAARSSWTGSFRQKHAPAGLGNPQRAEFRGPCVGGDACQQFCREAEQAKRFLDHPQRRIREGAKGEIANRLPMAAWDEREHAEESLPS